MDELKKGVLIGMYLEGVREIKVCSTHLIQVMKPDHFEQKLFGNSIIFNEVVSFSELYTPKQNEAMVTYALLEDLIFKYCPEYSIILGRLQ